MYRFPSKSTFSIGDCKFAVVMVPVVVAIVNVSPIVPSNAMVTFIDPSKILLFPVIANTSCSVSGVSPFNSISNTEVAVDLKSP